MLVLPRPYFPTFKQETVSIENNIDKIFEYLRIMTNHKANSAVIPPVTLRRLLLRIEDRMRTNPRLRLPYDPRTGEVWKYYGVIKGHVGHTYDHTSP